MFAAFNVCTEARTYTFDFSRSKRVRDFLGGRRYALSPRYVCGETRLLDGPTLRLSLGAYGFDIFELLPRGAAPEMEVGSAATTT